MAQSPTIPAAVTDAPDILMQRRVQQLTRTVGDLVEKAVQNERILRRYQEFELAMLGVSGMEALLDCLLGQSRSHFQLDAVELWLLDQDKLLRGLLDEELAQRDGLNWLDSPASLAALYPDAGVRLATVLPAGVFARRSIRSAALLPLTRRGRLIGSLHLGSFSAHRFAPDKFTDFIGHLGSIAAMCLENAVNQERLHRLSLVDPLTQVENRRAFDLSLQTELARAVRQGEPLTLMLADLDHFKAINDQHGHQAGDMVLRRMAAEVQAMLRRTDHVCRYGGEEFAFILPNCGAELAHEIAERIRSRVQGLALTSDAGLTVPVSVSIGFTSWADPVELPAGFADQLVAAADSALYRAKAGGRNRIGFQSLA